MGGTKLHEEIWYQNISKRKGILMPSHRGLKLDGAIGQEEICNSLKSENLKK